jgi:hypothetical protein
VQTNQGKDGYQTGGLYASKDNGDTWTRVNSLNPRPFYFSNVRVDPADDNLIYVLGDTVLWKSTNGGKQFASAQAGTVHPDYHALWIDPKDGRHMILGCDGGFYSTYDRGANWDHLNVLALGQFYHVAVDSRKPYRVYGGLQDNGSWGGPSRTLRGTGPANEDWLFIRGGDGFVCRVDPNDSDWVYSESQNGFMGRQNLKTGEQAGERGRGTAVQLERAVHPVEPQLAHFLLWRAVRVPLGRPRRRPEADQPGTDPHEARVHVGHRGKPQERGRAVGRHRRRLSVGDEGRRQDVV